jgi:thiol-disulfide isomerase/thioredoxin
MKLKGIVELFTVVGVLALVISGTSFLFSRGGTASVIAEAGSGYQMYDSAKLSDEKSNILFFKANWCGSCTGLHEDLEENVTSIPHDVQILQVQYEQDYAARNYYNVRVQHTLVQVDGEGNEIKKWQGSSSLEELLNEII